MDIQQIFLIVSSILAGISPIIYAYEILKGKAQPHRTTRLVLLIITALAFSSLIAQNNKVAVWLAGVDLVQSTIIFILSLKYGEGKWAKMDFLCLGIAGIGILVWQITSNPLLGLYAAILADFTGISPTLVKTYKRPESESWIYFFIGSIACAFNLAATKEFTIQNISYPLYLMLINLTIVLLVLRPKLKINDR
jgi:hypothetical protein